VLQLLKEAYLSLKAHSRSSKFGVIYKIIPQFKAILKLYKLILEPYSSVDFNTTNAPKNHLVINLQAA
jgi:hypothetical protein